MIYSIYHEGDPVEFAIAWSRVPILVGLISFWVMVGLAVA